MSIAECAREIHTLEFTRVSELLAAMLLLAVLLTRGLRQREALSSTLRGGGGGGGGGFYAFLRFSIWHSRSSRCPVGLCGSVVLAFDVIRS